MRETVGNNKGIFSHSESPTQSTQPLHSRPSRTHAGNTVEFTDEDDHQLPPTQMVRLGDICVIELQDHNEDDDQLPLTQMVRPGDLCMNGSSSYDEDDDQLPPTQMVRLGDTYVNGLQDHNENDAQLPPTQAADLLAQRVPGMSNHNHDQSALGILDTLSAHSEVEDGDDNDHLASEPLDTPSNHTEVEIQDDSPLRSLSMASYGIFSSGDEEEENIVLIRAKDDEEDQVMVPRTPEPESRVLALPTSSEWLRQDAFRDELSLPRLGSLILQTQYELLEEHSETPEKRGSKHQRAPKSPQDSTTATKKRRVSAPQESQASDTSEGNAEESDRPVVRSRAIAKPKVAKPKGDNRSSSRKRPGPKLSSQAENEEVSNDGVVTGGRPSVFQRSPAPERLIAPRRSSARLSSFINQSPHRLQTPLIPNTSSTPRRRVVTRSASQVAENEDAPVPATLTEPLVLDYTCPTPAVSVFLDKSTAKVQFQINYLPLLTLTNIIEDKTIGTVTFKADYRLTVHHAPTLSTTTYKETINPPDWIRCFNGHKITWRCVAQNEYQATIVAEISGAGPNLEDEDKMAMMVILDTKWKKGRVEFWIPMTADEKEFMLLNAVAEMEGSRGKKRDGVL